MPSKRYTSGGEKRKVYGSFCTQKQPETAAFRALKAATRVDCLDYGIVFRTITSLHVYLDKVPFIPSLVQFCVLLSNSGTSLQSQAYQIVMIYLDRTSLDTMTLVLYKAEKAQITAKHTPCALADSEAELMYTGTQWFRSDL